MRALRLLLLLLLVAATTAQAVEPNERLADPALEARARALSKDLRCLVCQNELIDESNANLAHDIRVLLRERIQAGDSDDEVRRFLVSRYGDFVLLKPPFEPATYALWFGPPLALALAGLAIALRLRRPRAEPEAPPLSDTERQRLARLLKEEG